MDHNMVLRYDYINRNRWRRRTNAPPSLAISMAMAVRWCDTACISRWRRSSAFIEATKRRHRATTRSVLPRRPPGRQQTVRRCKMNPLCWSLQWPWRCADTTHVTRWRRFVAFIKATKRRHRASTRSDSINRLCSGCGLCFCSMCCGVRGVPPSNASRPNQGI